jgi:ubiquinone biosynthesis protein UbiJ
MSTFSADTLIPLFSALPEEEQVLFAEKINKMITKTKKPTRRKRKTTIDKVADQLGEQWRAGNEEMLLSEIMNGG